MLRNKTVAFYLMAKRVLPPVRIEEWKLEKLIPWADNPRDAEQSDLERLRKQLEDKGQYKPLLVAEDGTVLGGNMRLRVMQEMNVDKVWVSVVKAEDAKTKLEYALSDNDRIGYYVQDKLNELIADAPDIDLDVFKVDLGFTTPLSSLEKTEAAPIIQKDENTLAAQLETYQNSTIKQVVLYFKTEEFDDVLERLQHVMSNEGVDNHTEAFMAMLKAYEDHSG